MAPVEVLSLNPTWDIVEVKPVEDPVLMPTLKVSAEQRIALLHDRTVQKTTPPGLHLNTVKYRQCPLPKVQINFRVQLLRKLRQAWRDSDTEVKFLKLVNAIEADGVALFGGLIDTTFFTQLVAKYDKILEAWGNKAFMHSYINLAQHFDDFLSCGDCIDAFVHPLLVALIAYLMGGPVRIMDVRGKDTDPISINAQDNLLHVDNTPFKEEYKVLLN
ncbi:hypothetical protein F4810DRAFT_405479 [Camillea tinctor]|nr:hypothetical protein F4810DRAFT_405479 [Camillea tinctor]